MEITLRGSLGVRQIGQEEPELMCILQLLDRNINLSESLAGGATEEELLSAESELEFPLPLEYRCALRLQNGQQRDYPSFMGTVFKSRVHFGNYVEIELLQLKNTVVVRDKRQHIVDFIGEARSFKDWLMDHSQALPFYAIITKDQEGSEKRWILKVIVLLEHSNDWPLHRVIFDYEIRITMHEDAPESGTCMIFSASPETYQAEGREWYIKDSLGNEEHYNETSQSKPIFTPGCTYNCHDSITLNNCEYKTMHGFYSLRCLSNDNTLSIRIREFTVTTPSIVVTNEDVKCYLQKSGSMSSSEVAEGLDMVESTNLKYFGKEMVAEFMALKGAFLAQIGRLEDANKAFSSAVQLHDNLAKSWALWGDYLDQLFTKDRLSWYQVKCYLQKSGSMSSSEVAEGLDMVESTNLKYFGKEMVAEFMALKGAFLAQIGRLEDANKAFSSAVQLHDNLAKSWALWGDYLDQLFTKDRNLTLGVSALTCYLHACRNQSEPKCRKYLARIIWMLTYDDEKSSLAEAVDKYYMGISPVYWLPWIPQLLTCLVRREGVHILNLLCSVGKAYPQAVYFPFRTLYLTLKMEQREKYKADQSSRGMLDRTLSAPCSADPVCESMDTRSAETLTPTPPQASQAKISTAVKGNPPSPAVQPPPPPLASVSSSQSLPQLPGTPQDPGSGGEGGPIRAPASLWRCSRIMHLLRDLHPTLLSALEGIVDQMIWFRESWYEELLRQLNEGLSLCQTIAFENREDFLNTQTCAFRDDPICHPAGLPAHEAVSKRASQDPAFQRLKTQFTTDFDFSNPGAKRLHNLITKLKKWIKILELKTKSLPKSFLLEERCRFLSNFSLATAEVEIPGEYLVPRQMPYYVKIARFIPRVELIQRHNSAVRRLCIQGDNGKIYPYLVLNDAHMVKCRREERVLQLISMMNLCLEKDKETSRRHLLFTIPQVVAVSPQMTLIEDNTSDVSLGEIFKQYLLQSGLDSDHHILQYYEKLSQAQARGEPLCVQVLQNIFTQIQSSGAPPTILKDWSERTVSYNKPFYMEISFLPPHISCNLRNSTCFRKVHRSVAVRKLTNHLSLCGLLEFILHLTRLDPDMCHIMRNSETMTYCFYTFEINKQGELDANRPVPFRLTPCLQTLISPLGISGPLQMTMIATARCLVQPKFSLQSMLQAILRDEFIAWKKKQEEEENNATVGTVEVDNEEVIRLVTSAVIAITTRLQNLAEFEDAESKVTLLISAASNVENLCRMDPAWNPWL
ncbi:hypothetical protein EMCRGX_G014153 [Ephydatia muelleri]